MKDYVQAPSKATKKKRIELKDALLEAMGVIFRTKFHNLSFLSMSIPMEAALRMGFSRVYPRGRHLALVNESTLTKLRNGEVLAALETLGGYSWEYFWQKDLIAKSLAPIIASTVYRGGGTNNPQPNSYSGRITRNPPLSQPTPSTEGPPIPIPVLHGTFPGAVPAGAGFLELSGGADVECSKRTRWFHAATNPSDHGQCCLVAILACLGELTSGLTLNVQSETIRRSWSRFGVDGWRGKVAQREA